MTQQSVSDLIVWLDRMRENTARAIELSESLTADTLSEDNPLFWALVKCVENAQESAKQIDRINYRFFEELIEFDKGFWKSLRGMRDRLAHKFWDIDPSILWETVRVDFAHLLDLLSTMQVYDQPIEEGDGISLTLETEHFLDLPDWPSGTEAAAGLSFVAVRFTRSGNVKVFRIGHDGLNLRVSSSTEMDLKVYGVSKSSDSETTLTPLL